MATQFFLRTDVTGPTVSGYSFTYLLATTRGAGATNVQFNTTASGNHIEVSSGVWAMQVDAVTISSTITLNLRVNEVAMSVNAQGACRISQYDSSGTFIADVVANANAKHTFGTEMSTSEAAQNWTATPTSTSFSAGDILVIAPHADAIGTMNSGGANIWTDGPTGGASGDSFVTFTETITAFSGASATSLLIPHRHRSYIIR